MRGKGYPSIPTGGGGSPPHMRGKGPPPPPAGETGGDHPRTCGEKVYSYLSGFANVGSPPHMRGKDQCILQACSLQRITPAHAGKRTMKLSTAHAEKDHPRTCGEKFACSEQTAYLEGSPPHMRGKGAGLPCRKVFCRITPAHAGKSLKRAEQGEVKRDHPRTCGEKLF